MKFFKSAVLIVASSLSIGAASANSFSNYHNNNGSNAEYEVTITNLTYNQVFAPALVVSHRRSIALFEEGEPASEGIAIMAEGGDVSAIVDSVDGDNRVRGAGVSAGPLMPGKSTTVTVPVNRGGRLSVVSMLVNTNDAFLALNSVRAPRHGRTVTLYAAAYDAGTEINDELCGNIPGPACGGEGFSSVDGEGFIHIHRGFHGVGDLAAAAYDWRNPVAKITITRK
ncbi:MAG: spondin domain-containing protein [Arenicella sp.]